MSQLGLPLDWTAAETEGDFLVGSSNELAWRHLERPALWPVAATLLTGPRKSGRSLLGRQFARRTGGQLIDQAEQVDEELIFHAWNNAQASRKPLLIIADAPPPVWQPGLADLRSRLSATPQIRIDDPDDALVEALLIRLLGARGMPLTPELARRIGRRIERSHVALLHTIDKLDTAALARGGRLNLGLIRELEQQL
jgi:hypothetical protein